MTGRASARDGYQLWLRVGIVVIAVSAIAASAEALYSLALRTGYGMWTAASLPVALDVMAAVAAVAWLAPHSRPGTPEADPKCKVTSQ